MKKKSRDSDDRTSRRLFVEKVYSHAKVVIPYTWEGIKGYNPEIDEFYKSIIRGLKR